MAECLEFIDSYIMDVVLMSLQFYFFVKILKKKVWLPFYFAFAVCAVIVRNIAPFNTIAGFAAFVFLLTVCGTFVCREDFKVSLLYASLVAEIILLCYGIGNSLMGLLCPFLPGVFHDVDSTLFALAGQVAVLPLAGFCYYIVYRYFSTYDTAEMQQIFLVFIPVLMIFMMYRYINMVQFEFWYEEEGFPNYIISYWQLFVMHLLGLVSLFCILFSYKKMQLSFRLSTELSLLEQEEHSLNRYVEEAKTRYDRTKAFRHDIRNHIAVVKNLLQDGKMEEAVRYIEDMDDMAEKMFFPVSTNNPVVDILVGNKLGIAKNMGIHAKCSLLLPYPCCLRDIDLCIVLSNALDNAIQACRSLDAELEKYIRVSGRIQGDFLMIEIENGFHGKGAFKKGTGLANVKKVAEKYGGAMSVEKRENAFVLHVLLIVPQHPEGNTQQTDEK